MRIETVIEEKQGELRLMNTFPRCPVRIRSASIRPVLRAAQLRPPAAGFTLVETAIAVLLTSIMLLALYASFTCGYSMMRVAREDTRATQIMLQKMEAIRLLSYDQLSKYPTNSTVYFDEQDKSSGNGGAAYAVTFSAAAAPSSLPPYERTNMMLITVAANWNSGRMPRTRTMQTYVAKYGVQRYVVGN